MIKIMPAESRRRIVSLPVGNVSKELSMPDDILKKVISLISGDTEPESDKDMLLKQLAKDISQNKYAKFYRIKQGEADPSLGLYFFSVYKVVYPLQVFLKDPAKEAQIKQITLESFLDKTVMEVIKRLSPEGIAERKRSAGADLSKHLQADLTALVTGFDSPRIAAADKCYNLAAFMKQFVFLDFHSLLQKFDPEIKKGDFVTQPKFSGVDASILAPEIMAFLSVLPFSEEDDDWTTVFEILKYCKGGTDVIPLAQWTSLLASLKDLKRSKVLDLIAKLATGNPILDVKPSIPHETLSAAWLEQKTMEVREVILGIAGNQRSAQVSTLENAIFGPSVASRLGFYTAEKGRVLLDKNLNSYVYAPAINHLLAFIQDYFGREIQELCDILLVRGQWTNIPASRQMSDAHHEVIEIAGEITALDETLDEDGSNGPRLRGALLRVDRDRTQIRYINSIINGINEEALDLINRAVSSLIVVGKHFKMLMDDYEKKPSDLVRNWKELVHVSKVPISQRISTAYTKINQVVQLMVLETKPLEEE